MSDNNSKPDAEELRAQIDHTRDELSETVEALAAKADVKGRATQKAHEVQESAKARAATLQESAKSTAQNLQETAKVQAASAKATVTEQAKHVGEQAKAAGSQARSQAVGTAHSVQDTVTQTQRERPWLLPAIGGATGLLAVLLFWRRRNR